ncbi:hypothetical protein niasHS_002248 [Heterodera schachtii]|uniref:Uncharacterized protein n=1 Tax=Heterodera schachtii TaxID=97005 RepID=A0ABD2KMQ0_HETSC
MRPKLHGIFSGGRFEQFIPAPREVSFGWSNMYNYAKEIHQDKSEEQLEKIMVEETVPFVPIPHLLWGLFKGASPSTAKVLAYLVWLCISKRRVL